MTEGEPRRPDGDAPEPSYVDDPSAATPPPPQPPSSTGGWTSGQPVASEDPAGWGLTGSTSTPPPTDPNTAWAPGSPTDPNAAWAVGSPTETPQAPVEPPRKQGLPSWTSWVVGIVIIAVIAGVGLIFRDRLSGAATDLRVGDCFDEPANMNEVTDVQFRPCNEAHDGEVMYVADYPDQDAFPGESAFDQYVLDFCVPAFETYVGRDYETDTEFDFGYFFPSSEGWNSGDHEVTCYVFRVDREKLSTSVKAGS